MKMETLQTLTLSTITIIKPKEIAIFVMNLDISLLPVLTKDKEKAQEEEVTTNQVVLISVVITWKRKMEPQEAIVATRITNCQEVVSNAENKVTTLLVAQIKDKQVKIIKAVHTIQVEVEVTNQPIALLPEIIIMVIVPQEEVAI